MRVLLLGSTDVRSSDATLLLARALERGGATVRVVPLTTDLPLMAAVGFVDGRSGDPAYQASFNRMLLGVARRFQPDLVFLYGSNWCVLPETIRRLRQRDGCRVALWEVNQHIFGGLQAASIRLYDHVFVLDSHFVSVLRVAGARRVDHLSACADPEEHAPPALSAEDERRFGADVSFLGTMSDDRASMLRHLIHTSLRIYGTGWDGSGAPIDAFVQEEPVYGLKKNKVYAASRLSLNVHQPHMVNGENFRVFEVAACGGVSVSAAKPDLLTCLEPGSEVLLFEDGEDLRHTVDYYLSHPDERDEVADAGRKRVLAEHTYDHRARAIMEALA